MHILSTPEFQNTNCFQKNPTRSTRPTNPADGQIARAGSRFPVPNQQSRSVKSRSPDMACRNQSSPPRKSMGAGGDRSITSEGTELLRRRVVGPRPSTERRARRIQRPPEPERAGGGAEDRRRRRVLRRTGKETNRLDFQILSAYREKEPSYGKEPARFVCYG